MTKWKQKESKVKINPSDNIIVKLAKINGIKDVDKFLNPSIEDIYDHSLLANIDVAVSMITKAILAKMKIVIFADCDYDGISATAIMYRYLKNFTENVEIIHMQRQDGHGLHLVEGKIPPDTGLLLVLDSSTNDVDACKRVSESGIPIVIIDHHDFGGIDNPYATIVNPRMPDCDYPNKQASGGLMSLKVCMALDEYLSKDYVDDLSDLAGFSLLADQMSVLEPENRYYIMNALTNIKNTGLKVLLNELKFDMFKFNAIDFLFNVSPCVTAITRLNQLEKAIRLLTSDDLEECLLLSKELVKANEQRKKIQRDAIELVGSQIRDEDKCLVIVEPSIGKSFNGVVAQEISVRYKRPAIILGESEKAPYQYSGSYRSLPNFDMREFLKSVKLARFAEGHAGAGGTACYKNKIEEFKKEINEKLKDVEFEQSVLYDLEINSSDITEDLINKINRFYKIVGVDLSESKFLIKDMFILDKQVLGSGDTLKMQLCPRSHTWFDDIDNLKPTLTAMKFKANSDWIDEVPLHKSVDVIGSLNINVWTQWKPVRKTTKTLQVFIEDVKISE